MSEQNKPEETNLTQEEVQILIQLASGIHKKMSDPQAIKAFIKNKIKTSEMGFMLDAMEEIEPEQSDKILDELTVKHMPELNKDAIKIGNIITKLHVLKVNLG